MRVHLLYENPDWLPPLIEGLEEVGLEPHPWALEQGLVFGEPEPGIYLNRMSPSSHTRGHQRSVGLTREVLAWLEMHGARVINGRSAFEIEMSKMRQYMVLRRHGIRTPTTGLAVGDEELVRLAGHFDGPFITKHNQGGKGLGISLFEEAEELEELLARGNFDMGPDGQVIIQDYIEPAEPHLTRVEMVGGQMILAMESSTEDGFELCPSDVCQVKAAQAKQSEESDHCPVDGGAKFRASPLSPQDPLVARYRAMCAAEGIEIAGIEFVEDAQGRRYTYDINGTTNYNQSLGREIGVQGMVKIGKYIRDVVVPALG